MALALDGHNGAGPSGSFAPITLTTANADDIVVFAVYNESNSVNQRQVVSIAGGGLTFARAGGYAGGDPGRGAGVKCAIELWWAHAPAPLAGENFTVTMDGGFDDGAVVCFGVSGAYDTAAPFDAGSGLPVSGTGGTLTFDTDQADDFVIVAFASSFNNNPGSNPPSAPGGFGLVHAAGTGGGALFSSMGVFCKIVSAAQAGVSVISAGTGSQLVGVLHAITANATGSGPAVQPIGNLIT